MWGLHPLAGVPGFFARAAESKNIEMEGEPWHLQAALGLVLDVLDLLAPRPDHQLDLLVRDDHSRIGLFLLIAVFQNG